MEINQQFKFRGQRYVCAGYQDHETLDGRWVELLVLDSECPDCGSDFRLLATRTNAKCRQITRRCEECRRPGVPVEPRRRRTPVAAAKPTARRKVRSSRLARQRLKTGREVRRLRKSEGALPSKPPAQLAPVASAEAIATPPANFKELYLAALGMTADG
jgi:hypothetical protein